MDQKEEQGAASNYKAHVLVLPFHGQGHMNPMLQFSKRLASKGLKITVAAILSATKSIPPPSSSSITLHSIYDDITLGGISGSGGFRGFLERYQSSGTEHLSDLIKQHQSSTCPINCLVYDANLPWALDIAREFGLAGAAFFTQSCAAVRGYHEIMVQSREGGSSVQGLISAFGFPNLASLGAGSGGVPPILGFILSQFSNLDKADWVLFNSFDRLEDEVVKALLKLFAVRTIGPTVPSMYLDKRLESDKDYGFNLFKSNGDACVTWLNTKEAGTVVYVSFGSAASLSAEQTEELAWGLKQSNKNFLWVVRASEEDKLPGKFAEETSEKGLVVTWCPQLEVLAHEAIGCFMTHCGWNSTVEAVSMGVPMVAMPQFLDQYSDAKFVEEVWRMGVRAKVDEKGVVTREEVETSIREVMEGERSEEIKRNASKWKELAKEAVNDGGSSDKNIEDIVALLVCG